MSSNERLTSCERLRHLVLELTKHYPVLFQEAPSLLHLAQEVSLYQIELEAQNEELQTAHCEIEKARQKYRDLYDLAPAAYFTFNNQGIIKEVNVAAALMIGHDASYLVDRPFMTYVDSRYVNSFILHIAKVLQSDRNITCELRVRRKDGVLAPVLIESIAGTDEAGESIIRAMVTDIGELWELKERLEFEELFSSLSTKFIDVPSDSIDSEITAALRRVIEFFHADRCAILEIQKDDRKAPVTHAVYAHGIEPIAEDPDLAALFPWRHERLVGRREIVSFSRLDELPPEAEQDRKTFTAWGVRSSLTIPVIMGNSTTHLISIDAMRQEREWSRDHTRLRLLAEVFINSLERKRKEMALRELKQQLERENIYLRGEMKTLCTHSDMVGRSDALRKVLLQIEQVAPTDSTALILGETGTGKELVAQSIHRLSKRKHRAMIRVNCASLPAALIESELFGRERGAYTGALSKQIGRFEIANGSTIFLDEIAELTPELQAKLLMVLQDGQFERLGSPYTVKVDVRVIAATNRDLPEAVRKGRFREDLFYRLNVFPIHVPPLRERLEDVPLLVMAFLKEFSKKMGKKIETMDRRMLETLQRYSWPGNVRELRNVIEQAVIMSHDDRVRIKIPEVIAEVRSLDRNLRGIQYRHIIEVLESTGWRIKGPGGAAEILGIKPSTLYTKMENLNIPTRQEKVGGGHHKT